MLGEKVSVLDVGRSQVGGIDALWGKTHRHNLLSERVYIHKSTTNFFANTRAYPRHSPFGSRLRGPGLVSIHFCGIRSVHPLNGLHSTPRPTKLRPHVNWFDWNPTGSVGTSTQLMTWRRGDAFWLTLLKGFGKTFLLILLASLAVGIGKRVYSTCRPAEVERSRPSQHAIA